MHPCVHAWTAVAFYYTRVEVSDEQRRVVTINNCAIGAQSNALGDAHWIIFRIISNGESFADTRQNFQANNGRLRKAISRLIAIETYTYLSSPLASPPPQSLPSPPLSPTHGSGRACRSEQFFSDEYILNIATVEIANGNSWKRVTIFAAYYCEIKFKFALSGIGDLFFDTSQSILTNICCTSLIF